MIGSPPRSSSRRPAPRVAALVAGGNTTLAVAAAAAGPASADRETKAQATHRKAAALAKSLASGIDGSSRAGVTRGVSLRLSLGSGRASLRLQVRRGDAWSTVLTTNAPEGETERVVRPGPVGRDRLDAATVSSGKIAARYVVTLAAGRTKASATRGLALTS